MFSADDFFLSLQKIPFTISNAFVPLIRIIEILDSPIGVAGAKIVALSIA